MQKKWEKNGINLVKCEGRKWQDNGEKMVENRKKMGKNMEKKRENKAEIRKKMLG